MELSSQSQLQNLQCYLYDKVWWLLNNQKPISERNLEDNNTYINAIFKIKQDAKFYPNIRILSIGLKNNETKTFKLVLKSCQYLESIRIWCGKESLDTFINYSNKNTYELTLRYQSYGNYNYPTRSRPEELESYLISWANRVPQKGLLRGLKFYFVR
ncbi:hypothetical protein C1645_878602 [Glomus cerebriforme]|uniref:Uncharacterized protein n=1 Tax=Glomus cerebriforme TaxID=658196 RepID=A0A397SKK5_9GLOM|nr:hypothetical protein C1645_878602 [Glomus cerebriforme]